MGLRVNTNVASLNAQRHLYNTTTRYGKSMERLSSGLRINRSGDDAAGLAISESLKSDIRALQQASRNAADGISLVQTAEGSLDEVNNILLRLRELAQQAATETLGEQERGYLNSEFQELLDEIDRISNTAEFNGIKLLDGSSSTLNVQVGIGTDASTSAVTIDLSTGMSAGALGMTVGRPRHRNNQPVNVGRCRGIDRTLTIHVAYIFHGIDTDKETGARGIRINIRIKAGDNRIAVLICKIHHNPDMIQGDIGKAVIYPHVGIKGLALQGQFLLDFNFNFSAQGISCMG
jgi:flagellin-like hook-associated protein FlgL